MSEIKRIKKPGTVIVQPTGFVEVGGDFEIEFTPDGVEHINLSGCQEHFQVGAAWALQQIAFALTPEGFDKGGLDISQDMTCMWTEDSEGGEYYTQCNMSVDDHYHELISDHRFLHCPYCSRSIIREWWRES